MGGSGSRVLRLVAVVAALVCGLVVLQHSATRTHVRDASGRRGSARAGEREPAQEPAQEPARPSSPDHAHAGEQVVVGLSRPLFEEAPGRSYTCARGLRCLVTSDRAEFGRAFAIIDVLKDPRKAGRLDFTTTTGQLRGVIIAEKDAAKVGNRLYAANRYDFEVGYNKATACMWKPFMCNEVEKTSNRTLFDEIVALPDRLAAATSMLERKAGKVVAFVSNCGGVPWRRDYLQELMKHINVDSYGTCLRNKQLNECPYSKEEAKRLSRSNPCARRGTHNVVKMTATAMYKFLFAFENQQESHYVTEKVYDGLRVATLPIYLGAPEVLDHLPPGSVILADQFAGPKQLADYLHYLDRNRTAYLEYFKWQPKAFAASPAGTRCPWQCRVCELKYDRSGVQDRCRLMAAGNAGDGRGRRGRVL
ncbi:hypothetical protein T492DRAFT_1005969 [Pavlovales sp. CCMP2436]|nr:hypothetical protein T492DRAFT_1005969 [Pavlovales sp. CCMP2436]|mmetsp:Transcript_24899/g.63111  ORF Transcript_24899/g.63111 Transcript_24899/m.63111 type:complete len:420 (-) Transcript_24899:92-1351(-)